MKQNKLSRWNLLKTLLLIAVLSMAFSAPAFAKNKALRYKLDFNGRVLDLDGKLPEEEAIAQEERCTYLLSVFNPKKVKFPKKVVISGDIIIPAKLFTNEKSFLEFKADLNINETKAPAYDYVGCYPAPEHFRVYGGKKPKAYRLHEADGDGKWKPASSKSISVKKKSGYYVIHFKTTADTSKVAFEPAEGKKLNKKKKVNIHASIPVIGHGLKSGYVYIDNLKLKSGKTTISYTFDTKKKEYRGWGYQWGGDWEFVLNSKKAKVVKRPVK